MKTKGSSKIYQRNTIDTLPPTKDKSLQYWRKQAKYIFQRHSDIQTVECVTDGKKLSSQVLKFGEVYPPKGFYVIIASTGGRWGRSRREYS